ncbi:MAG: DUF177 domain-containing protein [Rikenellaceae bacterium]
MEFFNDYILDYQSLESGEHSQIFDVDGAIFRSVEESEVDDAAVKGEIVVVKYHNYAEVDFDFEGSLTVACDRCLDPVLIPIQCHAQLVIRISDYEEQSNEADIMYINRADERVDLAHYVYETIMLSLPVARMHTDISQCNPDVVRFISQDNQEE